MLNKAEPFTNWIHRGEPSGFYLLEKFKSRLDKIDINVKCKLSADFPVIYEDLQDFFFRKLGYSCNLRDF